MRVFSDALYHYYDEYGSNHVLDLYVMCFSRHDPDDEDGRLSMWRGYGENGKGAAIVFDSSKVPAIDDSPLALAPVYYGTREQRKELIRQKAKDVAGFIRSNRFPDDSIYKIAFAVFRRLCLFAVFSKHIAFTEEQEWRLVYFKDRDERSLLTRYFSYFNGPSGIQPKLKLPTVGIPGVIDEAFSLLDIIDLVIIGPSASSPLAKMAIERMFESIGKASLKSKPENVRNSFPRLAQFLFLSCVRSARMTFESARRSEIVLHALARLQPRQHPGGPRQHRLPVPHVPSRPRPGTSAPSGGWPGNLSRCRVRKFQ